MNTEERKKHLATIDQYIRAFDEDNLGLVFFVHENDCGECEHRYHYVDRHGLSVEVDSTRTKFTPFECLCDYELQEIIINIASRYGKLTA